MSDSESKSSWDSSSEELFDRNLRTKTNTKGTGDRAGDRAGDRTGDTASLTSSSCSSSSSLAGSSSLASSSSSTSSQPKSGNLNRHAVKSGDGSSSSDDSSQDGGLGQQKQGSGQTSLGASSTAPSSTGASNSAASSTASSSKRKSHGKGKGKGNFRSMLAKTQGTGLDGSSSDDDDNSESSDGSPLCSICRGELKNTVKLKCGHKYCYACLKGCILQNVKECPYCRRTISPNMVKLILQHPEKICRDVEGVDANAKTFWVYEGRRDGWWNYDNKSNTYLERAFENWRSLPGSAQAGTGPYNMTVCGTTVEIDFRGMLQVNPKNGAKRRIDRLSINEMKDLEKKGLIKGMGGIRRPVPKDA